MQMYKTYYMEEGSLAREAEYIEAPTREQRQLERERQRREERRRLERNKRRQLKALRVQALVFSCAIFVLSVLFASYVHVQNNITKSRNHINSLKEEISVLKADNGAAKNRIASSLNLNAIKEAAVTKLGMVYADTDRIVYYNMPDEDFMNQVEPLQ